MRRVVHPKAQQRWKLFLCLLWILLGLYTAPASTRILYAQEKGPGAESIPDIDDSLAPGKEPAGDADSLADLEKAIIDGNDSDAPADKRATAGAPPPAGAPESPPPDAELPPSDDVIGLSQEATAAPVVDKTAKAPATQELPPDLPEMEQIPDAAPATPATSATPAPAGASASSPPVMPGKSNLNQITNLEFKMEGPTSRIVISSRVALNFKEMRNPSIKQVVYVFENTEAAQRIQRAYDTTEFPSPVALFTLLQMPSTGDPVTKLIIQLREDKPPTVTATTRGLYIDFPTPDQKLDHKSLAGDENYAFEENIYTSNTSFAGQNIKLLEVKNSDVQDVLRLIARSSGYNIVVGDEVSGKVGTLSLSNVPWDQAFALVLQTKKLGYVRQGNVLRVGTLGSLRAEKEEALSTQAARENIEPLRTVLIPISYGKASDYLTFLTTFTSHRGTVSVDTRTNTIILKDIEKASNRIQKLISGLDSQPPRVAISARFVEIQDQFARNVGFGRLQFSEILAGIDFNHFQELDVRGIGQSTIRAPDFANLEARLEMGELESKVKTLANPSVTVVANQSAQLLQTLSFFIQVPEAVNGQIISSVRQIVATLSLDVTPIVAGDGSIFMNVTLRNEVPTGTAPAIAIDGRYVRTQLLLENGDTAVLGGVFTSTYNTGKEGIPFLMDVPVLGILFRRNALSDRRTETFIFLTAKILNLEESLKRSM